MWSRGERSAIAIIPGLYPDQIAQLFYSPVLLQLKFSLLSLSLSLSHTHTLSGSLLACLSKTRLWNFYSTSILRNLFIIFILFLKFFYLFKNFYFYVIFIVKHTASYLFPWVWKHNSPDISGGEQTRKRECSHFSLVVYK